MALDDLSVLDKYKTGGFVPGYPAEVRTFYSPVDDVHGVLVAAFKSITKSLYLAMYGFDDDELAAVIFEKLNDEKVAVLLTLDSSQAGGVHERTLLAKEHYPNSLVAVGRSERGAIMHMKEAVIDGIDLITGSTNWSDGGETKQDNELTIHRDTYRCSEAKDRQLAIHANMLAKASGKKPA